MVSAYRDALRPVSERATTHNDGIVFAADKWNRLRRFLMLGTESGSFYVNAKELTLDNLGVVRACLEENGETAVMVIREVSVSGRAPKAEPALLALAVALRDPNLSTRRHAEAAFNDVVRTGTHLLHIVGYLKQTGGWNRLLRRTVGNWFLSKKADDLAYQAIKYPSRDGISLDDVLRMAHPKPASEMQDVIFRWITKPKSAPLIEMAHGLLVARDALHANPTTYNAVTLIHEVKLPREAIPTELLNDVDVWNALLTSGNGMPMTAMVRNLAKMTAIGLIADGSHAARFVADRLGDQEHIRKSRIHPIQLLAALKIYEQGRGEKGSLTWRPVKKIVTALDEAFYLAFKNIEPSGKSILVGLDVSGSMKTPVNGMPYLTAREAAVAMAMVTLAVEPNATIIGFSDSIVDLSIRPSMRMDEVLRRVEVAPYGNTYCSLPIQWANHQNMDVDAFLFLTDSETSDGRLGRVARRSWGSSSGPDYGNFDDVLNGYRKKYGPTYSVVSAMAANEFSLNDPLDRMGLDVVGFDSSAPAVISDFIAGMG